MLYVWLAATLDLSLRHGSLPANRDYPRALRTILSMAKNGMLSGIVEGIDALARLDGLGELSKHSADAVPSGWVENDRSMYFLYEAGMAP